MTYYANYDGRYWSDPDRALVQVTSETLAEAIRDYELFPDDSVLVEVTDGKEHAIYCKKIGYIANAEVHEAIHKERRLAKHRSRRNTRRNP